MRNYNLLDLSLHEALKLISTGSMQLPEFQRNYVWRQSDQIGLLDSIQKGYPVGALLLLESDPEKPEDSPFGIRPFEGASPVKNAPKYLVLDGQQRLTTCFLAFAGEATPKVLCVDLEKIFDKVGGAAEVSINLGEFISAQKRPVHLENLLTSKNLLPISFMGKNRNELRQKLYDFSNSLKALPDKKTFGEFVDVNLHGYLDAFYDYKFPCVVLPRELDIEAVANVFTKLNSSGLKLSSFDLCVSKLFPKGVKLRNLLEEALSQNPEIKLLDDDGTGLLQAIALLASKSPKKATLVKFIDKNDIDSHWDIAVEGYVQASEVLKRVGATNPQTTPYGAISSALAALLAKLPLPTGVVERANFDAKVAKWVFQTAFLERYTEGTDAKKELDYAEALSWFTKNKSPEFLSQSVTWQDATSRSMGKSGARFSAILALLNGKKPLDFVNPLRTLGINVVGSVTPQLHHVFPQAHLRREGVETKKIDLGLNFTFLTAESNVYISDKAPSEYIAEMLIGFKKQGLSEVASEAKLAEIMSSHLIDFDTLAAMRKDDYDAFLVARGRAIAVHLQGKGIPVNILLPEETADEEID